MIDSTFTIKTFMIIVLSPTLYQLGITHVSQINSDERRAEGHKSMNSRPLLTTQMHILVTNFYNWFLLLCGGLMHEKTRRYFPG